MRVRAVGHACLEIEAAGQRIVTDPWWAGPAYCNQWYPWPTPRPDGLEGREIDLLYLSHGHEDHLHAPTLERLRPGARALVPELLSGSLASGLRGRFGFREVIELRHGRTVLLRGGLRATCYVNLTDSILVLDDGEQVIVDANDALHASPRAVLDHFCRLLRENHPKIDALFLGYGGASWFPTCVRLPGRDDREVARRREALFSSNFARAVELLRPKVACAFGGAFALLEPHNRWINEVKLSMPGPDREQLRGAVGTRLHLLLPGDILNGTEILPGDEPRPSEASFAKACETVLAEELKRHESLPRLPAEAVKDLVGRLDGRVRANRARQGKVSPFRVQLMLRDAPDALIRIAVDEAGARAELGGVSDAAVWMELRSEILESVLAHEHGLESIVIGYGAVVHIDRPERLAQVRQLLGLLTAREGSWRAVAEELKRRPVQALGGLWRQRWPLALSVGARLGIFSHAYQASNLGAGTKEGPKSDRSAA